MVDRIQQILKQKNLTASRFADEIGIQRSSISHILSGRNNPSLEIIQKILKRYPDINSMWLISGIEKHEDPLPKNKKDNDITVEIIKTQEPDLFSKIQNSDVKSNTVESIKENKVHSNTQDIRKSNDTNIINAIVESESNKSNNDKNLNSEIERIVIFYKNKTFKDYKPE